MAEPKITHEMFSPYVNSTFRFRVDGRAVELELTEVKVMERGGLPEEFRQPFLLIFQGPKGEVLQEGLYNVESDAMAAIELYLIPILSTGERQSYQVVYG